MGDDACCGTCELFAGKEPAGAPTTHKPMEGEPQQFKIVIREMGGAAREYLPTKSTVIIGRVAGNDIVLPKGNVSKRATAIAFRNGHVIATDLKSSCGTYIDGRKISAATKLGENAKIYIGDFILEVKRR